MELKFLSRNYLETLSSADLISLADDYGIDIPDNLNRRFIIGELLEIAEEIAQKEGGEHENIELSELEKLSELDSLKLPDSLKSSFKDEKLPETFNETEIAFVFKNPVWVYVYWDIKNADVKKLEDSDDFKNLSLRVSYFESETSNNPTESFDVQLKFSDREQFVMLSANKTNETGKKFVRIDLIAVYSKNVTDNLAVSKKIALPEGSEYLGNAKPGREIEISDVIELSGMKKILKAHYESHRESFV